MKILSLHCDYIKFKPLKKALKIPEEITREQEKEKTVNEVLVVFTAVESSDNQHSAGLLVENIIDIAKQVKADKIVLYPYAHLSSNLAKPEMAMNVLIDAEKKLKQKKYKVERAPFGYYKEFELKCKGHPLSELSREISLDGIKKEKREIVLEKEKYDYKQLLREISKTKLDTSKLKKNDHRILGQNMDLFSFSEVAPGMVFWHNKGLIIYNEMIKFMRQELKKRAYQEIKTPEILDKKLWQISGHWEKYRENIFMTKYEERDFAAKPMNCPGGLLIYKKEPKSYKDFPLRIAEFGIVHRQELSGVLAGLFRVIEFTQDDAHIFCTESQLESELSDVIELVETVYKILGFNYNIELSTRPSNKDIKTKWKKRSKRAIAENILEKVLQNKKMKFKINKGEGAFYGPKIDFHIKDSLNRTWQLATIQLDFSMPERFDLTYIDKDNGRKRPVMIHRAIFGSIERFIGILLEHTNGHLPLWLSPIQVRVLSFTSRNNKSAEKIYEKLKQENIRVDLDIKEETVNSKVRNAELQKIPYILVIGDKEEKNNTIAVRERGKKPKFGIKIEKFIEQIKKEIRERT